MYLSWAGMSVNNQLFINLITSTAFPSPNVEKAKTFFQFHYKKFCQAYFMGSFLHFKLEKKVKTFFFGLFEASSGGSSSHF